MLMGVVWAWGPGPASPTAASSSPVPVPELSAAPAFLTSGDAFSIPLHASLDGILLCSTLTFCKEKIIRMEVVFLATRPIHAILSLMPTFGAIGTEGLAGSAAC